MVISGILGTVLDHANTIYISKRFSCQHGLRIPKFQREHPSKNPAFNLIILINSNKTKNFEVAVESN